MNGLIFDQSYHFVLIFPIVPSVILVQLDLFVAGDSVLRMLETPSEVE